MHGLPVSGLRSPSGVEFPGDIDAVGPSWSVARCQGQTVPRMCAEYPRVLIIPKVTARRVGQPRGGIGHRVQQEPGGWVWPAEFRRYGGYGGYDPETAVQHGHLARYIHAVR